MHSLRHTYATMCIESGMTPDVLKGLLGHTDIRITMNTYADVFDSYQRPQMDNLVKYLYESGLIKDTHEKSKNELGFLINKNAIDA